MRHSPNSMNSVSVCSFKILKKIKFESTEIKQTLTFIWIYSGELFLLGAVQ